MLGRYYKQYTKTELETVYGNGVERQKRRIACYMARA